MRWKSRERSIVLVTKPNKGDTQCMSFKEGNPRLSSNWSAPEAEFVERMEKGRDRKVSLLPGILTPDEYGVEGYFDKVKAMHQLLWGHGSDVAYLWDLEKAACQMRFETVLGSLPDFRNE